LIGQEERIRLQSLRRIAAVFCVPIDQLQLDMRFGADLKCSFVSWFRANEYDQIDRDIHDAADSKTAKELASGALEIQTVGDYCEHMVRCYVSNSLEVDRILKLYRGGIG
jgi:hypothetical protein